MDGADMDVPPSILVLPDDMLRCIFKFAPTKSIDFYYVNKRFNRNILACYYRGGEAVRRGDVLGILFTCKGKAVHSRFLLQYSDFSVKLSPYPQFKRTYHNDPERQQRDEIEDEHRRTTGQLVLGAG